MSPIFSNAEELVGNTPLVQLKSLSKNDGVKVFAKLEHMNPTGSIKDRIVKYMLDKAYQAGELNNIKTLVEASSGNTATSLAFFARRYGLKSIVFVPEGTSEVKASYARMLGAEVIEVSVEKPHDGCAHYMDAATQYVNSNKSAYLLNQYDSTRNRDAHYHGLGQEIVNEFNGQVDAFVSVGSTGGTISGVGKRLREKYPEIQIILADPIGSVYHSLYNKKPYLGDQFNSKIEGAGKSKMTKNMDFSVIDTITQFNDSDALNMVKYLCLNEGLYVGGSSGANALIAKQIAYQYKKSINIVTIFPDSGFKYPHIDL